MDAKVEQFIKAAFEQTRYDSEKPLLVITSDEIFFDQIRAVADQVCAKHQQEHHDENDLEQHEVENVRVLWIQPNDYFTPRGLTACGCVVSNQVTPSDECLKAVTFALTTLYKHHIKQAFCQVG